MARIFFIFLQIQLGSSFILLNGSSVARLSSFEFQQLSQLLINEEHSRNHLENNLTSLEQRVSEIESDLKTKYAQDIANVKDALEGQMNHTKSLMEKEINTTKAALNHQAQALEKEKSDRRQLEREYTKLIMDFNNLSRAHSDLRKENVNLNESIRNYSTDTSTKLRSLMVDIQAVNVSSEMQKGNLSALDGVVGHLEQNAGKVSFVQLYLYHSKLFCSSVRPSVRPTDRASARPPVRPSVRPSVRPPVRPPVRSLVSGRLMDCVFV